MYFTCIDLDIPRGYAECEALQLPSYYEQAGSTLHLWFLQPPHFSMLWVVAETPHEIHAPTHYR